MSGDEAIGAEFGRPADIVDLFHVPEPVTGQVNKSTADFCEFVKEIEGREVVQGGQTQ